MFDSRDHTKGVDAIDGLSEARTVDSLGRTRGVYMVDSPAHVLGACVVDIPGHMAKVQDASTVTRRNQSLHNKASTSSYIRTLLYYRMHAHV